MTVHVYGKQGCGRCEAAEDKLKRLGVGYEKHTLEYHTTLHDGWQDDGSIDIMAAYQEKRTLPLLSIDDRFYTYAECMKELKSVAI